jgi:acetyl esterase/lipase
MQASSVRWPILVVLALAAGLLAGCWLLAPPARGAVRTARLMPAFFAGLPVQPEAWGREPPAVSVEPIAASGPASLHIYRPREGRYPALIFSLGVNPAPPDDPRVVRLLAGLARAGLVVMLLQSTALDQNLVTAEAPDLLVRTFERAAADPGVRADRIGFAGFSVGAGLVSVAAADARIRDRVTLVEAFGGYYNLEEVVAAVTTSSIREGDARRPWSPDPMSREVITTNLVAAVPEPSQQELVMRALAGDAVPLTALDPAARAVYDVLTNSDPERAAELYARLPAALREGLRAVSPAAHIAGFYAPVFLMHDRGDPLIPYVESRRFRDALTAAGRPPYASEFDIFEHVDPTRGGSPLVLARDGLRLFMHIHAVLSRLE